LSQRGFVPFAGSCIVHLQRNSLICHLDLFAGSDLKASFKRAKDRAIGRNHRGCGRIRPCFSSAGRMVLASRTGGTDPGRDDDGYGEVRTRPAPMKSRSLWAHQESAQAVRTTTPAVGPNIGQSETSTRQVKPGQKECVSNISLSGRTGGEESPAIKATDSGPAKT